MLKFDMALSREFVQEKFKTPFVIGIGGVATAGKDTFFAALVEYLASHGIVAQRYAFADSLKNEIDPFMKEQYGISAWTKDPEEKKLIRPMLVAHGGVRRRMSKGTHWTGVVTPLVKAAMAQGIIPVITDVRYAEYDCDEVTWLNNLGGKLVYVRRYKLSEPRVIYSKEEGGYNTEYQEKVFVQPPNEDEARNDPNLRKLAHTIIEWPTLSDTSLESMTPYVEQFINNL